MTNEADSIVRERLRDLDAALRTRDRLGINAIVADLVERKAPIGRNWQTLAEVMLKNGEIGLALDCIQHFVSANPGDPAALFQQASVWARAGRPNYASRILATIPASIPTPAANAFILGMLALNLGEIEIAQEQFSRALDANPRSGQAWLALAMTARLGGSEATAERLLAAAKSMEGAEPIERAQYAYARGKVLDEMGDADAAFASWSQGASILRATRPYDRAADEAGARRVLEGASGERIAAFSAGIAIPTGRPIFVTGLPRSGSTLVEQILVSNSACSDGTELGKFGLIIERIGGNSVDALDKWVASGSDPADLAADYLHIFSERFGKDGRAVDKTLEASRYLGLVAALLPQAPLIWIRRNPLDSALSCYRTYFSSGLGWSLDLESMAAHFRLEDELLDRWREVLGDRLLVLDYESLVRDPAALVPAIASHCGMEMEPQMLEPHKTERAVTTASVTQVRRSISPSSIGSGAQYRAHLEPFIAAYTAAGGAIE